MKLREQLSYANVVATLALVIAVAGIPTAVAVTTAKVKKNSVGSKQIKNGSIRSSDLANFSVTNRKLGEGVVTASKLGQINRAVASVALPAASVACAPGEVLLGGGGQSIGGPLNTSTTSPQSGAEGWMAGGPGAGATNTAIALCLAATP